MVVSDKRKSGGVSPPFKSPGERGKRESDDETVLLPENRTQARKRKRRKDGGDPFTIPLQGGSIEKKKGGEWK